MLAPPTRVDCGCLTTKAREEGASIVMKSFEVHGLHVFRLRVYRYESSKVLKNVLRDHQPNWRIRSRMSPL